MLHAEIEREKNGYLIKLISAETQEVLDRIQVEKIFYFVKCEEEGEGDDQSK